MTTYYPIVLETEASGAVSAYVPGLPVYAAADTRAKAARAIRATLAAYLNAHPDTAPTSAVRVARVSDRLKVQIVGVGALLGAGRSQRKARASQLNGRLGGRPRKTAVRKKHVGTEDGKRASRQSGGSPIASSMRRRPS